MAQLFRPRANAIVRLVMAAFFATTLIGACFAIALNHSPYLTGVGSTPEQPVPFSHKHHVGGLGIDCRYCHTSVEQSTFAGLPDTRTCMTCHSQLWTNAEMLEPVRESLKRDEPLRWQRVHNLADYVYFDHRAHVTNGVGCESCHGRVDKMPLTSQRAPLTMQWCLDCHRSPAPHLRGAEAITAMGHPPPDSTTQRQLMQQFDIEPERMSECDVCHR
ncbi:hypothetical protein [Marinimicrobium locisalis]|uniref:hypothetical protein n=1 Tax=Marinimicrobium locisalis TaxID=546022 RepID=UPI003221680F